MSIRTYFGIGFDLLEIKLYRFMNYQTPVIFNFESPYIVISGPTGSGKTTILEALTFALFGRCSRLELGSVNIEDVCAKRGNVICIFRVGENKIRIKRGRDSKGKSYLELFINEERVLGKIPDLNEKIRSTILGMNYQAFVNSTIIRQDEMKSLGSKKSTERLKTLQNLFRLDIFEKAIINTQNQITVLNGKINKFEGQIEEKESQYSKITDLEKELEKLKPQVVSNQKKYEELIHEITELEKNEKNKREKHEQFRTIEAKRKDTQIRHKHKLQQIKDLNFELEQFLGLKKRFKDLELQIDTIKNIEDELKTLDSNKKEYELIKSHIKNLEQKKRRNEELLIEDIEKKHTRRKKEFNKTKNLDTTISHEEAFKILNQEGRLLERIQRISKEKTWSLPEKIIQEIHEEQIQARKDISDLKNKKEKITKDSFVLSEKLEQISELDIEISNLEERLNLETEINNKELQTEKNKLKQTEFSPEKENILKELRNKSELSKKIKREFEKIKTELESKINPSGQINTFQKEIKDLESEISKFNDYLRDYPKFLEDYELLLKQIKEKKKEIQETNDLIIRLDQEIKGLDQKITELSRLKPEIDSGREIIDSLKKEEDILQKLRTEVFHTKGAPFYAINKILPRIGKRASLILAELTNQRFSHIQLEKIDKGNQGMGFEILIRAPDGMRDVATFSGGERTQINAALRLAISEEISLLGKQEDTFQIGKKTLFIDEGDLGSLDTLEAQAAFVKKLFTLSNNFKIILITHLQEIANQFPNSINIMIDRYGRSVKSDDLQYM